MMANQISGVLINDVTILINPLVSIKRRIMCKVKLLVVQFVTVFTFTK